MLIETLKHIQEEKNLTDDQFAKSIGIHRVSWSRIKHTGFIGPETLLNAVRVYPELKEEFLSSFVKENDKKVTAITTTPSEKPYQNAQNKHQGSLLKRLVVRVLRMIKGG